MGGEALGSRNGYVKKVKISDDIKCHSVMAHCFLRNGGNNPMVFIYLDSVKCM